MGIGGHMIDKEIEQDSRYSRTLRNSVPSKKISATVFTFKIFLFKRGNFYTRGNHKLL